MKPATVTFSKLVDKLQQHYGSPTPPPSTDPLELIIWGNIAYLASDVRRAAAFAALTYVRQQKAAEEQKRFDKALTLSSCLPRSTATVYARSVTLA